MHRNPTLTLVSPVRLPRGFITRHQPRALYFSTNCYQQRCLFHHKRHKLSSFTFHRRLHSSRLSRPETHYIVSPVPSISTQITHYCTTTMAGNPLSSGSLAAFMATSLPRDPASTSSSEPSSASQVKNPYDAIALLCHAAMLAVGFKLIGLGEDHKIGIPSLPPYPWLFAQF